MDEYPVQSLGFINRLKNRLSQVDQRTALDVFIVILILVGLAASVYLAGQRQIFRSRAAENGSADVVNEQGQALPKNEDGSVNVETQQIRLKIDFPTTWQSQRLLPPYLFSPAYAAEAPQCLNQTETFCRGTTCINANYYDDLTKAFIRDGNVAGCYQCSPSCSSGTAPQPTSTSIPTATPTPVTCFGTGGRCASPNNQNKGVTSEGLLCDSYLSNRVLDKSCADTGTGYNYCYLNCATPTAAAQPTATPAPVQACGGRWEGKRTECSADAKRDQAGCTYLDAWSRPLSSVCGETTPFCWACPESAFGAPPQPTVTPQKTFLPAVGGPVPTATPVPEQTAYIQVSLKQEKLGKDKCTSSSDSTDHCFQFSTADLVARGNLVDWWLPNQPGTYTIFVGFISNKGTYKPGPSVTVLYKQKTVPLVGGGHATTLTSTPKDLLQGTQCGLNNGQCGLPLNPADKDTSYLTPFKNICTNVTEVTSSSDCPKEFSYCILNRDIICHPQSATQSTNLPPEVFQFPLPADIHSTPPITTCNTLFEDCMRIMGSEGTAEDKEKCSTTKGQCEYLQSQTGVVGGGPTVFEGLLPAPTPTLIPEPNSEQFDTSKSCADQYRPCFKTLQQQGILRKEAEKECTNNQSICLDYKKAQCQEKYSDCGSRPGLYCLAPYIWCSFSAR